jgi:hypothetical protein
MEMLAKLWGVWRHGAFLALIFGLGFAAALLTAYAGAWAVNAALGAVGSGVEEGRLFRFVLIAAPLWVPYGLGMSARYVSSDKLKPEGYPEHV